MTAVLVAFLIVFAQMGANCAICHDLYFGKQWIVYETDHQKDTRTWKRNRDVESVLSLNSVGAPGFRGK